jgi:elongation factor 1-alpha
MINGLSQADVALIVVDARKKKFETEIKIGGQTHEYTLLAQSFGIRQAIVAVNKMDRKSVKYSKERYEFIKQ